PRRRQGRAAAAQSDSAQSHARHSPRRSQGGARYPRPLDWPVPVADCTIVRDKARANAGGAGASGDDWEIEAPFPPQRATTRNGALWGIADKLGVFRAYPPQRANWRNGTVWSNSQKNRAVLARQSSYGALWSSFRHYLRLVRLNLRVQSRDFPDAV